MPYVNYYLNGVPGVGEVEGESIIPLQSIQMISEGTPSRLLEAAVREPGGRIRTADVQLRPASPRPTKIFCVGLNYREHIQESKRELPTYPVLFPKFASNLLAANSPIILPAESTQVDWEGELAVIIGEQGRRIAPEDALHHVLGYSVANDVTMRDYQYKTHQWMQGKAWDKSTPLGPFIVRPDEVDIRYSGIRTFLNGAIVQESDLSQLIFSIPTLIATVSEFTELKPGDVILTGTPSGVGYRRDPQVFLNDGDVVAVEIDGVGRVENKIEREQVSA